MTYLLFNVSRFLLIVPGVCITLSGLDGFCGELLLEYNYDPESDFEYVDRIDEEHPSIGQSFLVPDNPGTMGGFGVKVQRIGQPGPLLYRIGSHQGASDIASGQIQPVDIGVNAPAFVSALFPPKAYKPGKMYYITLSTALDSDVSEYYKIFGTRYIENLAEEFFRPLDYTFTAIQQIEDINELQTKVICARNLDYGTETATYPEGDKIDTEGKVCPGFDLAFRIFLQNAVPEGTAELFRPDVRPSQHFYHFVTRRRDKHLGKDEWEITHQWRIIALNDLPEESRNAVKDLQRFFGEVMKVPIDIDWRDNLQNIQDELQAIIVGLKNDLPQAGAQLDIPESFCLDADPNRIIICGHGGKGVLRGCFYLEDILSFREAPVLAPVQIIRTPAFKKRSCLFWYNLDKPDSKENRHFEWYLSSMAHYGFNTIDIFDPESNVQRLQAATVFPELGSKTDTDYVEKVRNLVATCKRYGLDVNLHMFKNDKYIPDEFFEKYPQARGAVRFHGKILPGLCTSQPVVRQYLREAFTGLFKRVPDLDGITMIIGGEGFYFCKNKTGGRYDDLAGIEAPCPCLERSPEAIVAEMVSDISDAIHGVKPEANVRIWPYATFAWAKDDPYDSRLIELLPRDIIYMPNAGKRSFVQIGDMKKRAQDYNIAVIGPGDRFIESAKLCAKRSINSYMLSGGFSRILYARWIQRFVNARALDFPLDGFVMLYANSPHHDEYIDQLEPGSKTAEFMKWQFFDPVLSFNELAYTIASRDFGAESAETFSRAWEQFAKAWDYFPYSGDVNFWSPLRRGTAHPLFFNPLHRPYFTGGFRRNVNTLDWCTWGIAQTRAAFSTLLSHWRKGISMLKEAVDIVPEGKRAMALKELNTAIHIQCGFQTIVNIIDFSVLSREAHFEGNTLSFEERHEKLDRMIDIAYAEIENTKLDQSVIGESEPGFFATYKTLAKKIEQVQRVINEEIPDFRARISAEQE